MHKVYQYRIYPTKSQASTLNKTLDLCRKVYNNTLALKRDSWDYDQENITCFGSHYYLKHWKEEFPELKTVYSQVLQDVQLRVDLAFKAFFRRCKSGETPGYPRFKGKGRYCSITYPQLGFKFEEKSIYLSKIGYVKTIFHRKIEGNIKQVIVRCNSTKKWFISVVCENVPDHPLPESYECIGIDVGLKTFATLSNGETVENPKFYRKEEKELSRVQRKHSKEKSRITRKVVMRVYERISNKRENFIHQLSREIIDNYGTICFEKLDIQNMIKTPRMGKSIVDAAWGKLVKYTTYKAEDAGRVVALVNPVYTSQMCSKCGKIIIKDISVRIHDCPYCGLKIDRDLNASINILRLGLQSLVPKEYKSPCIL